MEVFDDVVETDGDNEKAQLVGVWRHTKLLGSAIRG